MHQRRRAASGCRTLLHGHVAGDTEPVETLAPTAREERDPGAGRNTKDGGVDREVVVVVARDRYIARLSERRLKGAGGAVVRTGPRAARRPEDDWVGTAVAVVVGGHGDIACGPVCGLVRPARGEPRLPGARARPPDRRIGPAVAVVVTGNGHVAGLAERGAQRAATAFNHEEEADGRTPDGGVRLPVSVVVARHRDIAALAEEHLDDDLRGAGSRAVPEAGAGPIDGRI